MAKWSSVNKNKPKGQMNKTRKWLSGPEVLAACLVLVPLDMDVKRAIGLMAGLVTNSTRSIELWWDKRNKSLQLVLVAGKDDIGNFKAAFRMVYPNARLLDLPKSIPPFFKPGPGWTAFDSGLKHGHSFLPLDPANRHMLVTYLANSVQQFEYGWIQIVFRNYDFATHLDAMGRKLASIFRMVSSTKYTAWHDIFTQAKPRKHPEYGGDFYRIYATLDKLLTIQKQSANCMVVVRGYVKGAGDMGTNLDQLGSLQLEDVGSYLDHVISNTYPSYFEQEKPSRYAMDKPNTVDERIKEAVLRLQPDPNPIEPKIRQQYDKRGLCGLGDFKTRESPQYNKVARKDVSLFLHCPDPTVSNLGTTRGSGFPSGPSDKSGAGLGPLDEPGGVQ